MDGMRRCGFASGDSHGLVEIEQCYSEREISGRQSGGITGRRAGGSNGIVSVTNPYSRGDITGRRLRRMDLWRLGWME